MVEIRHATEKDLPGVFDLFKAFYHAAKVDKVVAWDDDMVREGVLEKIMDSEDGAIIVAVDDDKVVGHIIMMIQPYSFGPDAAVCREISWLVDPEHRKSGVGKRLLDAGEEWAIDEGATHMNMATHNTSEPGRAAGAYLKRGYKLFEAHYLKRLEPRESVEA